MLYVALLDQVTKFFIFSVLPLDASNFPLVVIPNFFRLVRRTNPAAAFSIGPENPYFYIAATLIGLSVLVWFLMDTPSDRIMPVVGLGLVGGGAVGNLIDRIYMVEVRDFIEWHWHERFHWPAFNVADAAICIGVAIVVIECFRSPRCGDAEKPR